MVIRDKENFLPIIKKMLEALGYEKVEKQEGKGIDYTAQKDGERYCFKCSYEIDAVGEKKVAELIEAAKGGNYDHMVYITNSSFISSAKKKGDAANVMLWDRNTVDRMTIGIADETLEEQPEEKKSPAHIIVPIAAAVVLCVVAAVLYMKFFL